jgi:ankyrin repeat protein
MYMNMSQQLLPLLTSIDAATTTHQNGFTPLHITSYKCHETMTLMLLENGAHVEALSKVRYAFLVARKTRRSVNNSFDEQDGRTPLHYACSCGHRDIARILLDKGANMEAVADVGTTVYCCFQLVRESFDLSCSF